MGMKRKGRGEDAEFEPSISVKMRSVASWEWEDEFVEEERKSGGGRKRKELELMNRKAVLVMNRVVDKLKGKDFGNEVLGAEEQVKKLVEQATANERLCQSYIGWCPFW
eukprot:TRINITY_DN3292_c0_g2_i4.p3 TRINITY_DN3292_c0_g2~~TRINITY_DN3292_c0_g2_i4.p3  ORF type:complete len:109 (-),score=31.33 TRINITY_DN3292_c0_g2_i4:36-362(-)